MSGTNAEDLTPSRDLVIADEARESRAQAIVDRMLSDIPKGRVILGGCHPGAEPRAVSGNLFPEEENDD